MKTHRVWEGDLKQIVITSGNLLENPCQVSFFVVTHLVQPTDVTLTQDQYLERPDGPLKHVDV